MKSFFFIFIDYFKDGEFINDHESDNIKIEDKKRCVVLDDPKKNNGDAPNVQFWIIKSFHYFIN